MGVKVLLEEFFDVASVDLLAGCRQTEHDDARVGWDVLELFQRPRDRVDGAVVGQDACRKLLPEQPVDRGEQSGDRDGVPSELPEVDGGVRNWQPQYLLEQRAKQPFARALVVAIVQLVTRYRPPDFLVLQRPSARAPIDRIGVYLIL